MYWTVGLSQRKGKGVYNDQFSGLLDCPRERGKVSVTISVIERGKVSIMISLVDCWTVPEKGERCL